MRNCPVSLPNAPNVILLSASLARALVELEIAVAQTFPDGRKKAFKLLVPTGAPEEAGYQPCRFILLVKLYMDMKVMPPRCTKAAIEGWTLMFHQALPLDQVSTQLDMWSVPARIIQEKEADQTLCQQHYLPIRDKWVRTPSYPTGNQVMFAKTAQALAAEYEDDKWKNIGGLIKDFPLSTDTFGARFVTKGRGTSVGDTVIDPPEPIEEEDSNESNDQRHMSKSALRAVAQMPQYMWMYRTVADRKVTHEGVVYGMLGRRGHMEVSEMICFPFAFSDSRLHLISVHRW